MNPFLNPLTGLPFLKKFFFDAGRLQRMTPDQLKKHQDTSLKKIVRYAYTIPLYHELYRKAGVHPQDIHGIEDVTKLPFITKQDITKNYPNNLLPPSYKKEKGYVVCTSGSTGKPVSLYTDFQTMADAIGTSLRIFKTFDIHWRTAKIAYIMNYTVNKPPDAIEQVFTAKARSFFPLKNHLTLSASTPIPDIINTLDSFQPDVIISLPMTFQHMAFLKKKGYGGHIQPTVLLSGGYLLDAYTRSYVENVFECNLFNIYASCEANADIAYECKEHTWHINQDYFFVETIDQNHELVDTGKRGHLVLTRLFGKGTPILRYTGIDDWVKISMNYDCSCGVHSSIFIDGVEGRISSSIVLPDGRIYPAGSFSLISTILNKLNTYKIKHYQIIQKTLDEIDILLVFDDELKEQPPSVKTILKTIKKEYEHMVGPQVTINVHEVPLIESHEGKPPSLVLSHLSQKTIRSVLESTP